MARKLYGNIFSWRLGRRIFIFLCDYNVIKTALKKPEFSGRPPMYSADVITDFVKRGMIQSNGKVWQNNRRFALFHLKNLGLGKSSYEASIQDEVMCLLKDLGGHVNKEPGPITWSLNVAILNVIWRICADRRYEVDDPQIHHFHQLIDELFSDVPRIVQLYDFVYGLHKIVPSFISKWAGIEGFTDNVAEVKKFLTVIIEEHKKTVDSNHPRDFIDQYLMEMDKQKNDPESTMNELDLLKNVVDLFVAGSETTSSTIRWTIFYLAQKPDIQKKLQEELDSVFDRNTLPSLGQKDRLPYLDAVIHESQRFVSLVALGVPHYTVEDTNLNGYFIPKDSVVLSCLDQCHFDPAYWKKPNEFYPENFLDDEGKMIKNKPGYVPFSIGKRSCLGESLANMELFLFLSAIFQSFTFTLPEGEDLNPKRNPRSRVINTCKPYKVIIKKRQ